MSIKNAILEAILEGRIKTASVIILSENDKSLITRECKILKVLQFRGNVILRLKPWKGYPLGHKFLYRSFDECFP